VSGHINAASRFVLKGTVLGAHCIGQATAGAQKSSERREGVKNSGMRTI
jgi:hypothetical protein